MSNMKKKLTNFKEKTYKVNSSHQNETLQQQGNATREHLRHQAQHYTRATAAGRLCGPAQAGPALPLTP